MVKRVVLALGANLRGRTDGPGGTLGSAVQALRRRGLVIDRVSPFYESAAVGTVAQPAFVNAVLTARTLLCPAGLLRLVKQIERSAGRRPGRVSVLASGPRALDIDIIDYEGRVVGWPPTRQARRGGLVLPHAEMHRRRFVLQPLGDIVPGWRHPVLRTSVRQLLRGVTEQEVRLLEAGLLEVGDVRHRDGEGGVGLPLPPICAKLKP